MFFVTERFLELSSIVPKQEALFYAKSSEHIMAVRKKFGIPARPQFQQQVWEVSCPPRKFKEFRDDGVRWQKVWEGARHVYGEVPGAQLHGPYARSIVSRKEFWITRKGSSLGRKSSGDRARRNAKSSGTLSPISKQFGREHVPRTKNRGAQGQYAK